LIIVAILDKNRVSTSHKKRPLIDLCRHAGFERDRGRL
jgi:hypothetical protein